VTPTRPPSRALISEGVYVDGTTRDYGKTPKVEDRTQDRTVCAKATVATHLTHGAKRVSASLVGSLLPGLDSNQQPSG
jgi:hypothetical protein